MKRVILATGGTGGHIFPALAVAEEIRRRNPDATILFMGGRYGKEADLAVNAGLDFVALPVRGVMRRGFRGFPAALGMIRGVAKALGVIRKIKPQLVVGFGGYASFPGILAARLCGVPTAVHEQNSFPGMANRLLGNVVDKVFLSIPDTSGAFPAHKTVLIGNPVRASIIALHARRLKESASPATSLQESTAASSDHKTFLQGQAAAPVLNNDAEHRAPRLLIIGGSLGAKALNDAVTQGAGALLEAAVEIWHQTGQGDCDRIRAAYREAGVERVRVEPFITDMQRAYDWADLALCRAGGSTMAEITAAGLPALLVPFPYAAQNHQRSNALFLEKKGGGVVLDQDKFSGPSGKTRVLTDMILGLLKDKCRLQEMAAHSLATARPRAASALVDELEHLAETKQE